MASDYEPKAYLSWMLNSFAEILKKCNSTTELICKIDEILTLCYQEQTIPKWTSAESDALTYWSDEVIKLNHSSSAVKILDLVMHCIAGSDNEDVNGMLKIYQAFSKFSTSDNLDDSLQVELWDHLHKLFLGFIGNHGEVLVQNMEDIGTELLSSVVDSSLPLLLRFLRLKELNEFLKLPSLPQRFQFRSTVKHYFKKLPKMLTYVGDYDFQASIVEAVFRMTNSEFRRREVTKWFPKLDCRIHSLFIRIRDFDPDVRRFLNAYNKCLGPDQLVFSIPCDSVSMGQVALVKPKVATYEKFWIDFNLGTCSILIICHKDCGYEDAYESVWEPIMVKVQDVVNATLVQTVHSFTLEIVLPSVEACANLFFSQASQEFEKLLTDTVVLEFPPQKNLARICRTIFEDKLKNSAEELDCWMANGSKGSMPFSGEKVSSSSSRQKKRTSSAHGLKAYQNSSKESKTDSSTFKIKIASDEHGRIPSKKKRRKSRNVTHVLSCTDSSELVEERPNNSRGKGLKNQCVSPLLHRQKKYLSSHSKKRAIESVVQQDLKVIPDSQDYEEIPGNVTEKSTEDEDVIPCSLNCQEQKKLSSFGCKTSVNIFPIMRKIESVTQVDLEVDVVEDESEMKDLEVDVVENESELKVEEKSCKKMFQNYEDVSSHNAVMVNVYQSTNSEGNRKQLSTSKIEFDKKQTMKNTKCSLAKSPLSICSISKSLKEPVNISPHLESSEPPPQSSTCGIKVSEIIIEKNLKKNQKISVLRKVQEDKDSVPDEKPLDNSILVPSPNPDERLLCNKTTIPPSPSPVEELFDSGSTLPPVRAEECVNFANTTYSPLSIAKSQLEKTGIVPEIKHCNSVSIDNEMKHLLFKSCTSATSAPATPNMEKFSAAKPFLTRSISESILKENGSQNLIEILPFHPKFDSFKTIRKENVVSLPQTCSYGSSMKWSKKKCNISISNTIDILNIAVNVESKASDSVEILNHSFSKTSAKHVEDSSALSRENLKSPRPSLLSTLKILAEYPIKSPVNYSSTRKEKKEIRGKELIQVLDTQVSTPRKISHPLSEHSSGNTPSRTFENTDKIRNTPKKKKLFDTSSFEILQDSPPMEQDSPPREEIIHSDMYTTDERHRLVQEARKSPASRLQAERVELNEIHINGSKRFGKQAQRKIIFKHKDTVDDKRNLQTQKLSCKRKSLKENEACLESRDLFGKPKSSKKLKKDKSNISELSGGFLEYPEIKDISAKEHSVYSDYSSSSVETEHSWLIKKKSKLSNVSKTYPNKGKTLSKSETTRFSSNEDWEPFKERKRKKAQKDSDTSAVKSKQEPTRKSKRRSCKEGISYYEKSPLDSDVELQKNSIISPTKSRDWEYENPVSPETLRHSESSVDSGNSNYLNFHLSQKVTENKKVIPISAKGDRIGNEISKCFTSFSDNSSLDLSFIALDNSGHKTLNKRSSVRSKNKLVFGVTEAVIHASEEGTCSKDLVTVSETFGEEVVIISEMSGILESNQTNNHFDCDGPLQSTLIQNEDGHLPSTGRFSYVADVENNSLCQGNNIELAPCAEETGGDSRLPESVSSFENNVYLPFENLQTSNDISKVSECSFGMKERFSSNQKTIETSGEVNSAVCRVLTEDEEVVTEPCHDDNQGIGKSIHSSESNGRLPEDKGKEVATSVKYVSGHEALFSEKIMQIVDREIAGTDLKSPTKNLSCNATGQGGASSSVVGMEEHLHGNQFVESSGENCAASAGKKSLVKHSFCQNANQSVIEKGISIMSPTISQVANCISPDTTNMNDAPPNTPVSQSSDTPLGEVLQLMDKLSNNGFQNFVQANGISPTSHVCDQTPTLPAPRQLFSTGDGLKNAEKGTNKQPRSSCLQLIELLSQSSDKHDFIKFMEDLKWFSESLRKVVSSFNTAVSSLHTLSASVDDVISNFGTGRS